MDQSNREKSEEIVHLNYQSQRIRCAIESGRLPLTDIENLKTGKLTVCTVIHHNWPYSGVEFYADPSDPADPAKTREVRIVRAWRRRPVMQLEVDLGEIDLPTSHPQNEETIPFPYRYRKENISKDFVEPL